MQAKEKQAMATDNASGFERQLQWSLTLAALVFAALALWTTTVKRPWEQVDGSGRRHVVVNAEGQVVECEACPCPSPSASPSLSASASPSLSPSASASAAPSPSYTGGYDGPGWYCVRTWEDPAGDCDNLACIGAACEQIESQEGWNGYSFGVCTIVGGIAAEMKTTDGVRHDSEAACIAAGCACP